MLLADDFLLKRPKWLPGRKPRISDNKRVRSLAPQIVVLLSHLARISPSWCDNLRLIDATPVPCGQSVATVKRSNFAGHAAYGWCAAHSRHFWGFKLYLLSSPDGMPIAFELAAANLPEREVVAQMLERIELEGYGAHTLDGLRARIAQRLLSMGACLWHNWEVGEPGRSLIAYDH